MYEHESWWISAEHIFFSKTYVQAIYLKAGHMLIVYISIDLIESFTELHKFNCVHSMNPE